MKRSIKTKLKRKRNQSIAEDDEEEGKTPTELSFKITRVAVAQICQSVGFEATQRLALETLTVITTKYMEEVAKLASSCSHESNRTESNLFDLINALHDIQGFSKQANSCLLSSSVLDDISRFVNCTDETPFAKPIPRNDTTSSLSSSPQVSNSRGLHIPKWLPAFPDPTTYKESKETVRFRKCASHLWENQEFVQAVEDS